MLMFAAAASAACSTVPYLRGMEAAVKRLSLANSPAKIEDAAALLSRALAAAEQHAHEIVDDAGVFRDVIDSRQRLLADAERNDRASVSQRIFSAPFQNTMRAADRATGNCDHADERSEEYRAPPPGELNDDRAQTRSPAEGKIKNRVKGGGDGSARGKGGDAEAEQAEQAAEEELAKSMRYLLWIAVAIGLAGLFFFLWPLRRRRGRRFACCAAAELAWGERTDPVIIVDISRRGARMRSNDDVDVFRGDVVSLTVFEWKFKAVVAWRGQNSFGVTFDERLARSTFLAVRRCAADEGGIAEIA